MATNNKEDISTVYSDPLLNGLEDEDQRRILNDHVISYVEAILKRCDDKSFKAMDFTEEKLARLQICGAIPEVGRDINDVLHEVKENIELTGIRNITPQIMNFAACTPLYQASLAHFVMNVMCKYSAIFAWAPGACDVELKVITWLAEVVGYPETASGISLSGGSMSTQVALTTATKTKNVQPKYYAKYALYACDTVHYCLIRDLGLLGMSDIKLRIIPSTEQRIINIEKLVQQIRDDIQADLKPFMLVGTLGTAPHAAIDPLDKMADIAKEYDLWFHVDGAFGGGYTLLEDIKVKAKGVERSDSITIDPHKSLNQPFGHGMLLVRDRKHLRQAMCVPEPDKLADTGYIFHDEDGYSPYDYGPELTRPFRAFPLWFTLQTVGLGPIRAIMKERMDLGCLAFRLLCDISIFEVFPYSQIPCVVVFRIKRRVESGAQDVLNEQLFFVINERGQLSLTRYYDKVTGEVSLVLCTSAHRTHEEHVREAVKNIEDVARCVLRKYDN